ncbi:acyl-CoA reductase LuxC [Christiangramia gaetbulicola]|uniref:Acyl-CoA reductase LuxC n=1 Tax=Christiangramia gaetbulicola TaxID=703340 RepID=A0A2T6AHC8_9FLAO|nr:acyl-CoA reductase [Christiangramia gaetbulicola]PTX43223.1 acyl-CoA reductase LuxC [Christiangramia gaetbulicola]
MTIDDHKSHLITLGKFLQQFQLTESVKNKDIPGNDKFFAEMEEKIDSAIHYNGWFNRENIIFSLQQWSNALTPRNLKLWLDSYNLSESGGKTVGIVMAGNIPLVGFHDFISVLVSGHKVLVKQSTSDQQLLPVIAAYLMHLDKRYEERIRFTKDRLEDFDAVIATGSNNTARYFEYYFKGKPSIIRKNRNSVAILTGEETKEDLQKLGEDIFRYYGLGCRNVSKLYVPENYDFDSFFKAIYEWNPLINQNKYANNYDYNKAVYLMSEFKLLDNGFLILKEDESFGSPIASLFYETYSNPKELEEVLEKNSDNIQCIVKKDSNKNEVTFGQTQKPELWDYADNVDTIEFLSKI